MNAVLQANIVRDVGGYLVAPDLPSREEWNAHLEKYAPGCGAPTYVEGTNGGQTPCGSKITSLGQTEPYFCSACRQQFKQTTNGKTRS